MSTGSAQPTERTEPVGKSLSPTLPTCRTMTAKARNGHTFLVNVGKFSWYRSGSIRIAAAPIEDNFIVLDGESFYQGDMVTVGPRGTMFMRLEQFVRTFREET